MALAANKPTYTPCPAASAASQNQPVCGMVADNWGAATGATDTYNIYY